MTALSGNSEDQLSASERAVWRSVVDGGWGLLASVNEEMAAHGLAPSDLRVLEALAAAPDRGISELAELTHIRLSTMSRHITRLIDDGCVERIPSDHDGRHRLVRVTDLGWETLREHTRVRDRLIRRHVIGVLTDREFETLGTVFRKIADNL
jgi:DNA-binding MarR family transcriptional regulator